MIYRSKAPFRIGLAGGGTDVSPYSDLYGGAILNATISLFAHASIELLQEEKVEFYSVDQNKRISFSFDENHIPEPGLDLQYGIYHRLKQMNVLPKHGFRLTTAMDVPAGSGLGTSSTLVVAILKVFSEWLNLPFGDYDLAHLAYEIERKDLGLAGGKQDQYAATFGGFNFMEFMAEDQVIVNPLRIRQELIRELENNVILYFTSSSRQSSEIIKEQQKNVEQKKDSSLDAMHQLKDQAKQMKDALLKGNLHQIGTILDYGFMQKRKIANNVSNAYLDNLYETAKKAGATGGKISGAGGGGFMFFYCPRNSRHEVIKQLNSLDGYTMNYQFTDFGVQSWKSQKS